LIKLNYQFPFSQSVKSKFAQNKNASFGGFLNSFTMRPKNIKEKRDNVIKYSFLIIHKIKEYTLGVPT
jgi:hypothetical protein